MKTVSKKAGVQFSGRWRYRLENLRALYWSMAAVTVRRAVHGPHLPGWTWSFEVGTEFLRRQTKSAFEMPNIVDSREYLDALVYNSPALARVQTQSVEGRVCGTWYRPEGEIPGRTLLYLHGGAYAYYAQAHASLIASIALACRAKTFALDYRLSPEHPYPAQLDDARSAYDWLSNQNIDPQQFVIAGDSAGGNLTLALLLSLRESGMTMPRLAVGIAPWTDLTNHGASTENEQHDFLTKKMAEQWSRWFCHGHDPRDPRISPLFADLRGLPPIYLQAGAAEVIRDMILDFARRGNEQGADVTLEVWDHMNHDFQAFGDGAPQSKQALLRLAEVVDAHLAKKCPQPENHALDTAEESSQTAIA